MRAIVGLMILVAAFAGCADAAEPAPTSNLTVEEVETGPEAGAITGVVVDEAIQVVEGASVTLMQTNETVITGPEGTFVFEDLEAGFFLLEVVADGFLPIQTSTEVLAGEASTVKVQLARDLSPEPFVETNKFSGVLVLADIYVVWTLQGELGNNPLCTCEFTSTVGPGAVDFVYEAAWEPRTPVPGHELYFELYTEDGDGRFAEGSGPPAYFVLPRDSFSAEATQFTAEVSSLALDVDQEVELFLTTFYNVDAPTGWSFVNGDPVP